MTLQHDELTDLLGKLSLTIGELQLRNQQSEKLLQRAYDLLSDAVMYSNFDPWLRSISRWQSDLERRDEWLGVDNPD